MLSEDIVILEIKTIHHNRWFLNKMTLKYIHKTSSNDHVTPYNNLHIWLSSLSKALTLRESAFQFFTNSTKILHLIWIISLYSWTLSTVHCMTVDSVQLYEGTMNQRLWQTCTETITCMLCLFPQKFYTKHNPIKHNTWKTNNSYLKKNTMKLCVKCSLVLKWRKCIVVELNGA
jgi:hypothetical protein